jgi:hypothetical protein
MFSSRTADTRIRNSRLCIEKRLADKLKARAGPAGVKHQEFVYTRRVGRARARAEKQ